MTAMTQAAAQGVRLALVMTAGAIAFAIVWTAVHRLAHPPGPDAALAMAAARDQGIPVPPMQHTQPFLAEVGKMLAFALAGFVPLSFIVGTGLAAMGPNRQSPGLRLVSGALFGMVAGAITLGSIAAIYAAMPVKEGELSLKPPEQAFILFSISGLIPGFVIGLFAGALLEISRRSLLKGALCSIAAYTCLAVFAGLIR